MLAVVTGDTAPEGTQQQATVNGIRRQGIDNLAQNPYWTGPGKVVLCMYLWAGTNAGLTVSR